MKKSKKTATQYSIDLDIKGMFFFVILALLTAIVVFYLGVLFGKASRDPSAKALSAPESSVPGKTSADKITASDLEIYNIRSDDDTKISTLKKETKSVLEEADRVIRQSKTKQTKPVELKGSEPQPVAAKPKQSSQWPDQSTTSDLPKNTWTVQVFATKDKDKANRIVRVLRQQKFDAYLAQVNIEDQTIYRVRVGRKSKTEIEKLDRDLQKVIGGMGMKSRKIKLN
jgi:cell division septation protein DedD